MSENSSQAGSSWAMSHGSFIAAEAELLNGLGGHGETVFKRLKTDRDFTKRTCEFMRYGGYLTAPEQFATSVWGKGVLGVHEAARLWQQDEYTVPAFPFESYEIVALVNGTVPHQVSVQHLLLIYLMPLTIEEMLGLAFNKGMLAAGADSFLDCTRNLVDNSILEMRCSAGYRIVSVKPEFFTPGEESTHDLATEAEIMQIMLTLLLTKTAPPGNGCSYRGTTLSRTENPLILSVDKAGTFSISDNGTVTSPAGVMRYFLSRKP